MYQSKEQEFYVSMNRLLDFEGERLLTGDWYMTKGLHELTIKSNGRVVYSKKPIQYGTRLNL